MTSGVSALNGGMEMPGKSKLSTTTRSVSQKMPPLHPGEMLREEFMRPLGLSANALALALRVPVTRISEIVNERRSITADTALRLSRYFRMSPNFWLRLQTQYDLDMAEDQIASAIRREVRPAPRDAKTGELKPAASA
jgi:addiction module HigA family antidote